VATDAIKLYRVEKARLSLRYVELKRKTILNNTYDPEEIEAFTRDWKAFNMSRMEEWFNFETSHRAIVEGKWRSRDYFEHWTGEEPEVF